MLNIKVGAQAKTMSKVGLDIGTNSIKIIEVAFSDKARLMAIGMKKNADVTAAAISDSLKALLKEVKISSTDVNISVSGSNAIVRLISMPKMKDEDLRSAIRFEAEKFIPFNISDCLIDFQILGRDDKENKLNVLLAAAKKDHVLGRIKLVEDAGFSVSTVDVDSFALANSFMKNFPALEPAKSVAIINIGSSTTNLSIIRGSILCFARDMLMGANDFTAAISKKLGSDMKSPQELKAISGDKSQDVINYAKQALGNFSDELRLSFSYYENQGGMGIDEIYVSGGPSGLVGLAEAFEESFGSRPMVWNPLNFLDPATLGGNAALVEKENSSFAVASGLALR